MIRAIVCVDENWAIGKNNGLLFHLPKDMQFFQEKTVNSIVVMGENTLLSLPGCEPLRKRLNIVLCQNGHDYKGFFCFHNFNELVEQIRELNCDVYIIGGGMLYSSMLPYCEEVYVTKVKADGQGTVFFPNLDTHPNFKLIHCSEDINDSGYTINFCTYKRI